jgi:hypothetical protein
MQLKDTDTVWQGCAGKEASPTTPDPDKPEPKFCRFAQDFIIP